jgi:hypothetical protein
MNLGMLIKYLEREDPKQSVSLGFDNPHSYRGYYDQLAFELCKDATVGDMLKLAKESVGKTFTGWKGGEYEMDEFTTVWLAEYGCGGGEVIGPVLLGLMLGKEHERIIEGWNQW